MAKPLINEPPTSTVARLLEPGVGRAALSEASREPEPEGVRRTGETPCIKREFILTPQADNTLRDLVDAFSRATGTQVTNSHLFRSLLRAVALSMPHIESEAQALGRIKRPSNARGREAERERYEGAIAKAITDALKAPR